MKKRRTRKEPPAGNGLGLTAMTFTEAYRDATYAIMLKMVEGMLGDPHRRRVIEDLTIQLLESMVRELKQRSSSTRSRGAE